MATIRRYFGIIGFFVVALLAPQVARAACVNDTDCPDAQCGGQICDWSKLPQTPQTCKPAGTQPQGIDGWCTTDADCKCKTEGATCVNSQCTRTLPMSAGNGGASGTAGTGSSAAGGSAAGSSAAGSSAAGASSSTDSSSGSSGCSIAAGAGGTPRGSLGFAVGAVCALGLLGSRRRKRTAV